MAVFSLALSIPLALYVLWRLYKRLRCDPLAPAKQAHWSSRYTGLWIWWQHVQDRSAEAVHQAHLRHGPVVRLGPSELSVCCVDGGLDAIYSFKEGMPKTDWYQVANSYGEEPMVAIKDESRHRERKRMLAQPYSKTALRTNQRWNSMQRQFAARLKSALDHMNAQESCSDFYDLAFAWSVESTSQYLFGRTAKLHLLDDLPRARRTRQQYERQRTYQFLPLPAAILDLMGYRAEIGWMADMMHEAQSAASEASGTVLSYFTHALAMKGETRGESESKYDNAVLCSELQDHMVAGIDTSAAILTACAWYLSLPASQSWQTRLGDELRAAKQPTTAADLEKLPVLDAVVKEVLRLYAPVAGSQPRCTTRCVDLGPRGHSITVPSGVTVHSQAHTLHRSSIFTDPEAFEPGRWLNASSSHLAEMERWFWPFGSGSRACIGKQLGMDNLKLAIAALYGDYRTTVAEGTTFAISKGVIAMPVDQGGYHLRLRVRVRADEA